VVILLTLFDIEFAALPIVFDTVPVTLLFDVFTPVFAPWFVFEVKLTLVLVDPHATPNAVTIAMHTK
jgi:hypothetical protein